MFIGHFAVAFAAKKINPSPSLGTYFLAAQFLDLLWPTFLLLGVEKAEISHNPANPIPLSFTHYPISHSLVTAVGWSIFVGLIYAFATRNNRAAFVLGLCVISHWVLDFFVHIPDLPLSPGSASLVGLGLWKMKVVELLIETLFFAICVMLYLKATVAINKAGIYATVALIAFLFLIHVMNAFGPPPPNMNAVAWAGQLQWIFVLWAYWVDGKRKRNGELRMPDKSVQAIPV